MFSSTPTEIPDRAPDRVLIATHSHRSSSHFSSTPSSESDGVREICIPTIHGSQNGQAVEVDNTPKKNSFEILDDDSLVLPIAMTSFVSDRTNRHYPPSRILTKRSCVSDDGSQVHGLAGMGTAPRSNEEPAGITATLLSTLASLTMYDELSFARSSEEFALVHARLQQEWTFDANFLLGIAAINAAILAINPDSIFKVDSYAHTAVAISITACGLGIACAFWFLLRYSWVDLRTFVYRSRDVYRSYVFFSLTSRMPTLCMLVSSISLMSFMGPIAYDAGPLSVLVIGVLVLLVMILQFIVYGTHQFATFVLRTLKSGAFR